MKLHSRCFWSKCGLAIALLGVVGALSSVGTLSCSPSVILNNTTSLGGDIPGQRGNIQVSFINNTPFRAIFTFGTYDPQDKTSKPQFEQFYDDADAIFRLEGNSSSGIFIFTCGRVMSIGGEGLISQISKTSATRASQGDINQAAFQAGIAFSDKLLGEEGDDQPTAGLVDAVVTLQGAEYQCDSLLVYTFEVDETTFRVDLDVILP